MKRALDILLFASVEFAVLCYALWSGFWGVWVATPWGSLEHADTYTFIASSLPEWAWGVVFVSLAVLKLWTLLYARSRGLQVLSNSALTFAWAVVAIGAAVSSPGGMGVVVYGGLAAFGFVVALRRLTDRRSVG